MKTKYLLAAALAAIGLASAPPVQADVFYSGLQNIAIPTDFNGVYLNLQTGVTTSGGNWDINPFFGGDGVATSPNLLPARIGTGNQDRIVNVGFGTTISSGGQMYSTGYGGSQGHIGAGGDQFQANTAGYIGFQYTTTGGSGWMRAVLNQNTSGGMLMDWAYESTSGASIVSGNIQQADTGSGTSTVTMTSTGSESPRLGSSLTDNLGGATSVVKSGTGTWTLGAANNYSGTTVVNGGTLLVANTNSGTGLVSVNNSGSVLGGTGSIAGAVNVGANATLRGGDGSAASGSLSIAGAVTMATNSIIELAFGAGGAHSTLALTGGGMIFASAQMFHFLDFGATAGFYNNIITGVGDPGPGISSWTITNSGWLGTFLWDGTNIDLTLVPVPEPGTWAAGVLAALALGWTQRKRLAKVRASLASR